MMLICARIRLARTRGEGLRTVFILIVELARNPAQTPLELRAATPLERVLAALGERRIILETESRP